MLAHPDAMRLRVQSLFGIGLDLAMRGDSMTGYVPARREGAVIDARREGLGIAGPGRLAYRVASGAWAPPDGAWRAATWEDSLLVLRWAEQGDSVWLDVGAAGLPARVRVARPDGKTASARYAAWTRIDGVAWPATVEFADGARTVEVTCRVQRVRFVPGGDPSRLAVRIPPGARRLTWPELRELFERVTGS